MNDAERSALVNTGGPRMQFACRAPNGTSVTVLDTPLPAKFIKAYCSKGRSQPSNRPWQCGSCPVASYQRVLKYARRQCETDALAPFDVSNLTSDVIYQVLQAINDLGMPSGCFQFDHACHNIGPITYLQLWYRCRSAQATATHRHVASVLNSQFDAYAARNLNATTLATLLEGIVVRYPHRLLEARLRVFVNRFHDITLLNALHVHEFYIRVPHHEATETMLEKAAGIYWDNSSTGHAVFGQVGGALRFAFENRWELYAFEVS